MRYKWNSWICFFTAFHYNLDPWHPHFKTLSRLWVRQYRKAWGFQEEQQHQLLKSKGEDFHSGKMEHIYSSLFLLPRTAKSLQYYMYKKCKKTPKAAGGKALARDHRTPATTRWWGLWGCCLINSRADTKEKKKKQKCQWLQTKRSLKEPTLFSQRTGQWAVL